jgi:8-oxo-dGTP pyrophosphatase MutT (NUDIX family)
MVSRETVESPSQVKSDSVATVRATVCAHEPSDERESVSKVRILEELKRLESPFDEEADQVHFTGSAIVVGTRGTILHLHKRLGRWMQTGGHLEDGEMPHDAALRESEEETGLTLQHVEGGPRLLHIDVHAAANGHTHLDLRYLLVSPDLEPFPPPGESPHARWFSWPEAFERSDDALIGALRAARSQPEVKAWVDAPVDDRNRF